MLAGAVVVQVHRWYRATAEHEFAYIKRFRILGERYRGKLSCKHGSGYNHLCNALSVIMNLCAYHNLCEQHRVHPPIPQLTDTTLLSRRAATLESDSDSDSDSDSVLGNGEVGDESAEAVDISGMQRAAAAVRRRNEGAGDAEAEADQPARKRPRAQRVPGEFLASGGRNDPHSSRADYGQYEYKWEEESGTGYGDEQFKRQQPVWMWSLVMSDWVAAVVTHRRRGGGVNVRMQYSDEREGVAAGVLRPRTE